MDVPEEFAKNKVYREQYDLCVSRAVSNLATLSEYCLPYVKVGGHFISYKSGTVQEELQQAEKAVKILGGKIQDVVYFNLPDSEIQRSLVVIEKIKTTSGTLSAQGRNTTERATCVGENQQYLFSQNHHRFILFLSQLSHRISQEQT